MINIISVTTLASLMGLVLAVLFIYASGTVLCGVSIPAGQKLTAWITAIVGAAVAIVTLIWIIYILAQFSDWETFSYKYADISRRSATIFTGVGFGLSVSDFILFYGFFRGMKEKVNRFKKYIASDRRIIRWSVVVLSLAFLVAFAITAYDAIKVYAATETGGQAEARTQQERLDTTAGQIEQHLADAASQFAHPASASLADITNRRSIANGHVAGARALLKELPDDEKPGWLVKIDEMDHALNDWEDGELYLYILNAKEQGKSVEGAYEERKEILKKKRAYEEKTNPVQAGETVLFMAQLDMERADAILSGDASRADTRAAGFMGRITTDDIKNGTDRLDDAAHAFLMVITKSGASENIRIQAACGLADAMYSAVEKNLVGEDGEPLYKSFASIYDIMTDIEALPKMRAALAADEIWKAKSDRVKGVILGLTE